ncbi:hypothetical protein D3C76_1425590 [compost metagenome]
MESGLVGEMRDKNASDFAESVLAGEMRDKNASDFAESGLAAPSRAGSAKQKHHRPRHFPHPKFATPNRKFATFPLGVNAVTIST